MIDVDDKSKCCGCSVCASVCPVGCISMEPDSDGFLYPRVEGARCIRCNRCVRVCPFASFLGKSMELEAYAARSLRQDVLHKSSSGGVFTELCISILGDGGVVYGVSMADDCRSCSFTRTEDTDGIVPIRGSKYLQADSRGVFERVRDDVNNGRRVLFSGTPCQANALAAFLGERRGKLTIVDLACHGVPSPRLWAEHVDDLERRRGVKLRSVSFRCKEMSWRECFSRRGFVRYFIYEPLDRSPYLQMFLRNTCLRESCYACKAKASRAADLTIADFWGIENVVQDMSDELGCSLVIVRTDRGASLLRHVNASLEVKQVSYDDAVRSNAMEYSSAGRPSERDVFYRELDAQGYAAIARKYGKYDFKGLLKSNIKNLMKRIGVWSFVQRLRGRPTTETLRYGLLYSFDADWHSGRGGKR